MNLVFNTIGASTLLLIGAIIFGSNSAMALGEFFAGLSGVVILIQIFIDTITKFHFLSLLSSTTLLSTGWGTFNTYVSLGFGAEWNSYILQKLGITSSLSVATAQVFVNIYCLCLLVLKTLNENPLFFYNKQTFLVKPPETTKKLLFKIANLSNDTNTLLFFFKVSLIISLYQLYLLYTGKFGFLSQGLASEEGIVNPEVSVALALAPMVNLALGFLTYNFNQLKTVVNRGVLIIIYAVIVITQLQWLFISASRRELGYSVVLFIFGLRLCFINNKIGRKNIFKLLLLCFILLIIIYCGVYSTSFLRFLVNSSENLSSRSLLEILDYTIQSYLSFSKGSSPLKDNFTTDLSYNLSTRTFVLSPLALLLEKIGDKPFLLGDELVNNLIKSIPGFIYPEKYFVTTAETLYYQKFGMPYKDIANSFYLSAFMDFSWLGMLIYPIIFYLLFQLTVKIVLAAKSSFFLILATATLFNLGLLGGESSLVSLFVGLRDLLLFLLITLLLKYFLYKPSFKL